MGTIDDLLARVGEHASPVGLLVLAGLSALEYLFPPFPGDVALVAAALLVAVRGWPLAPVLGATTGGSLAGALVHYGIGRWLAGRRWEPKGPRARKVRDATLVVAARFQRHGSVYLALNRFLPGLRSVFFLAAGYARVPLGSALLWGGVSAVLWNLLLVGAAYLVGLERERLMALVRAYSAAAWIVLGLAIVVWLVVRARRKRRTPRGGPNDPC